MMHKAWNSIEEVPYYFSRSSAKFQGHMIQKMAYFDPNLVFPDWFTACEIILGISVEVTGVKAQ